MVARAHVRAAVEHASHSLARAETLVRDTTGEAALRALRVNHTAEVRREVRARDAGGLADGERGRGIEAGRDTAQTRAAGAVRHQVRAHGGPLGAREPRSESPDGAW